MITLAVQKKKAYSEYGVFAVDTTGSGTVSTLEWRMNITKPVAYTGQYRVEIEDGADNVIAASEWLSTSVFQHTIYSNGQAVRLINALPAGVHRFLIRVYLNSVATQDWSFTVSGIEYRPRVRSTTASLQGIWRFRPSATAARTVYSVDGTIYVLTDPTTLQASDGVQSQLTGSPFTASERVCGTQHGRYFYLFGDGTNRPITRITPSFTLETVQSIPKPSVPSVNFISSSFLKFTDSAVVSSVSATAGAGYQLQWGDWYLVLNAALNDRCPDGGTITVTFTGDHNWSGCRWLAVVVTPPTMNKGGNGGQVFISVATQTGQFEDIGTISDRDIYSGAPNIIYCNLERVTDATRSAVRRMRFILSGGPDRWAIHGVYPMPFPPGYGPQSYYVTMYDTVTKVESEPCEEIIVNYTYDTVTIPTYHNVYAHRDWFIDTGAQRSLNPEVSNDGRNYNASHGLESPRRSDLVSVAEFSGTAPSSGTFNRARLWRVTETGRRLVKEVPVTPGGPYTIRDDTGKKPLVNVQWIPGGTVPRATSCASYGGRLVTAIENTITISDYVPVDDTGAAPRFAKTPVEETDGWSFELGPNNSDQVQALVSGDSLYILTNERCYSMPSLSPGTLPVMVFARGCVGRDAAIYVENLLIYASHDGIYAVAERTGVEELSESVRFRYIHWLRPSSKTLLGYRNRVLYVIEKERMLCFSFVTKRWTQHILGHSVAGATTYTDPGLQQHFVLCTETLFVARVLDDALRDEGLDREIGSMTYATGYVRETTKLIVPHIQTESDYPVQVRGHIDRKRNVFRSCDMDTGEDQRPFSGDYAARRIRFTLRAPSTVYRFVAEVDGVDTAGARHTGNEL